MIGKLKGIVDHSAEDHVILDVNGVGYVVHCSARSLRDLARPGEPTALWIETQLREDSLRLYGFPTEAERDWFRLLQSVPGVGAKLALAILGALAAAELGAAVLAQDKQALARAPGVGAKLAARLVAELKDKPLPSGPAGVLGQRAMGRDEGRAPAQAIEDAIRVLVGLGYGRAQAAAAVAGAAVAEGTTAAELIRLGLKELAQ